MIAGRTPAQDALVRGASRSVRAQLVGVGVRLRIHRVKRLPAGLPAQLDLARERLRGPEALAAFWCEPRPGGQLFVYLTPREGDRVVLRRIGGLDAAGRMEALGLILRQAAQALLSGGTVGIHPSQVPRLRRAPRPRPRPRPGAAGDSAGTTPRRSRFGSRHGLGIEVGYGLEGMAAGQVAHGFWGAVSWRIRSAWTVFAGFGIIPSVRIEGSLATMRLQRFPVAVGGRAHLRLGRFRLGASLALALEYSQHSTTSKAAGPDPDEDDLLVVLRAAAHGELWLTSRLRLFLELGATVYPENLRYTVGPGAQEVLLSPWPVRPRLVAGIALDLL